MRALNILAAAVTLGLAGGFAWSAMSRAPRTVQIPKAVTPKLGEMPETGADKEWAARALDEDAPAIDGNRTDPTMVERSVHYAGCNEISAAGKAPLHAGGPGYRSEMDDDGDGVACEPVSSNRPHP